MTLRVSDNRECGGVCDEQVADLLKFDPYWSCCSKIHLFRKRAKFQGLNV